MKNKVGIFVYCLLLLACGSETDQGAVISMEDFAGETGEIIEEFDKNTDTSTLNLRGPLNQFLSSQLLQFDTLSLAEFHPIDRFSYNQKLKIEFKSKTDVAYSNDKMVTPRASFYYYTFADTTKTKNAFYNWLDCFGGDCQQVKLFDDSTAIKMPPAYIAVYDTVIVIADYRCEDAKFNWTPFQDSLKAKFGKTTRYELSVRCGGPITWE